MSQPERPERRAFFRQVAQLAGAAAVTSSGCTQAVGAGGLESVAPSSAPPLPDGLDRTHFHVHNEAPLSLETRRGAAGRGLLTPNTRFFVRNNLPRPADSVLDDRDAWRLHVDGVERPGSLSLAELKNLGLATEAVTIQCSGNGRAFFAHGPSGSPWATGAAGCALWTGVRLRDVLAHMGGVQTTAGFLTATGGEALPEGVDRDAVVVERSIPIEKALDDALLAWEMNGVAVPITHGGPLRLVVPGYFGINHIKYVRRIAVTAEQTTAKIQRKGYRFRPIGTGGAPSQPSMWRMPVKSWLNGPGTGGATLGEGTTVFYGVALSGERGVAQVEVSLDGGQTWSLASFEGPDLGPNAWRTFSFSTELNTGNYTLYTRATDTTGDVQPRDRAENERGYGHNGWWDHGLSVTVTAQAGEAEPVEPRAQPATTPQDTAPRTLSPAGERGKQVFVEGAAPPCGTCHTLADADAVGAIGPSLDTLAPDAARVESAVTSGVGAMPAYGGRLTESEIRDVATYVAEATRR